MCCANLGNSPCAESNCSGFYGAHGLCSRRLFFYQCSVFNLTTSLKGYSPKNDFYSIKNTHVHETWHVSIDIKGQHDKLTVWFFIYVFI